MQPSLPTVAIFNNTENFAPFLARAADPILLPHMYDKGNRALLWLGDPKLVVLSAPAPHADYLRTVVGYSGTEYVVPAAPSPRLCEDILSEPALIERLAAYAGPHRQLQVVPYVTTVEFLRLAETLRAAYGIDVHLPESPPAEVRWVRDYLDSKAGFRQLVGSWLGAEALPEGFVCDDQPTAADAVAWFAGRGRGTVVKPTTGNGGYGQLSFAPDTGMPPKQVHDALRANPFLRSGQIVVEECIASPEHLFPAIEVYVPSSGEPLVTHLCTEVFLHGKVTGQVVAPDLLESSWAPRLAAMAQRIAGALQRLGYRGLFDIDGVVDGEGRLRLLEVNTRRTAGTHAHEFACLAFGADYARRLVVVCHNTLPAGRVTTAAELLAALDGLLYRAGGPAHGVVVTHTACLREAEFGCLLVAESRDGAASLQTEMLQRLGVA
jgi:hypothetical protein